MKNVVRRFLLILPVMFCMVLGLAVPISSYAISFKDSIVPLGYSDSVSYIPSSSFDSFSWVYPDFDSFSTSSDFSRYIDSSNPYFYFEFASQNNSVLPTLSYTTCQCCFSFGSDLSDYNCTVSGNLLTCTFNSRIMYYRFTSSDSGGGVGRGLSYVYSFTYDLSSREIYVYNSTHDVLLHVNGGNVKDIVSNLPELSNNLDVTVEFQPALSGSVDRTITNGSGASGLSQQLNMRVINNSRFAIQYDMQIVKTEQNKLRDWTSLGSYSSAQEFNDAVFDDDPIFIYYDNDWVYAHSLDDSGSYFNGIPTKQQKSTQYHYLAAGASDEVTFNYSQINLQEGCSYTVTVRAVKCDYDCASELLINAIEDVYPEMKQISLGDLEVVYSSSFSMLQYNDVKYDPSDSSNGVVPYDGSKGLSFKERYANSYNAVQNSSGQVDYKSKNLYDDPNSFWNKTYDPSSYSTLYPNYRTGFSNTPASVNNLSASISNFGSFLQSIFSYFPSGVFAIFNLALVMVVIIAIIKVVR